MVSGYTSYRLAEWESTDSNQHETVTGTPFETRLQQATNELSKADAEHPNHYFVLELLGLVNSEPRRATDLSVAEQYFERAIRANPFDYYGHELLADVLRRRVGNRGVDLASRATIEKAAAEAQQAIDQRETSGTAHLLRAEILLMLIEIERDGTKRSELRTALTQNVDQAARFLPQAFGRPDPDLTWVRIVAATRQLGEVDGGRARAPAFDSKKRELEIRLTQLINDCATLEERWVAQQRVSHIKDLDQRARGLREEIRNVSLANWRDLEIRFSPS